MQINNVSVDHDKILAIIYFNQAAMNLPKATKVSLPWKKMQSLLAVSLLVLHIVGIWHY